MNQANSLLNAQLARHASRWIVIGCLLAMVASALVRTRSDVSAAKASNHDSADAGTPGGTPSMSESTSPEGLSNAFRSAARRVLPAVVEIKGGEPSPSYPAPGSFGPFDDWQSDWTPFDSGSQPWQEPSETALGSGIVIDSSGIVLTNSHVVRDARRLIVQLADGRRFEARNIQADPESDLAILRIKAPTPLPAARFGDSDRLEIGDWVLTVGSPLDLRQTVSAGIISATGRKLESAGDVRLLQTDAAINPGSSGGALVDLRGDIVGVTTAIASHDGGYQGIGLAIPSNTALWVVDQLRQHGEVRRSTIGIETVTVFSPLGNTGNANRSAAKVTLVRPDSSAEKAGICVGDEIVAIDDISIYDADALAEIIRQQAVGSKHGLKIERDGSSPTIEVVTELAVKSTPPSQEPAWDAGEPREIVYSRELQLEVSTQMALRDSSTGEPNREGVVILSVHQAGPAYQAGVREGMRLLAVNGHDVRDLDSFVDMMERASLIQGINLTVQTDNGSRRLSVTGD